MRRRAAGGGAALSRASLMRWLGTAFFFFSANAKTKAVPSHRTPKWGCHADAIKPCRIAHCTRSAVEVAEQLHDVGLVVLRRVGTEICSNLATSLAEYRATTMEVPCCGADSTLQGACARPSTPFRRRAVWARSREKSRQQHPRLKLIVTEDGLFGVTSGRASCRFAGRRCGRSRPSCSLPVQERSRSPSPQSGYPHRESTARGREGPRRYPRPGR